LKEFPTDFQNDADLNDMGVRDFNKCAWSTQGDSLDSANVVANVIGSNDGKSL
jgi:hypothetical protein